MERNRKDRNGGVLDTVADFLLSSWNSAGRARLTVTEIPAAHLHIPEVRCEEVAEVFPVGTVEVVAVNGGLRCDGLCIPAFGDCDKSIEAAVAAVEVYVEE